MQYILIQIDEDQDMSVEELACDFADTLNFAGITSQVIFPLTEHLISEIERTLT